MTIKETITKFAQDYYSSKVGHDVFAQSKNLTRSELSAILICANVLNEKLEKVRVKNLIDEACSLTNVTYQQLAELISYRQADLINVTHFRRPLPKKNLILLEKYVAEHKNAIAIMQLTK